MLSKALPRPSILIAMPAASSTPMTRGRELASLIRVEYLRLRDTQGVPEDLDAKLSIQRD